MGVWGIAMLLLFLSTSAFAHPVTFKQGTAIFSVHRPKMTHLQVNYTFARNFALATTYLRLDLDTNTIEAPIVHLNSLVKRWNQMGAQANIYTITGFGYNLSSMNHSSATSNAFGYLGLQVDYETTRIYTALSGFTLGFADDHPFGARYRFGIAPYLAKYNDLQIWVIGQLDYMSDMKTQPVFTPMLRFFYRTVLWETGVSLNGTYWFQMMAHF